MITIEECKHIEELSKLEFSEDERKKFLEDFSLLSTLLLPFQIKVQI